MKGGFLTNIRTLIIAKKCTLNLLNIRVIIRNIQKLIRDIILTSVSQETHSLM